MSEGAGRAVTAAASMFSAHDAVRFTRDGETHVGHLQYRYVNQPMWLVYVAGRGEMWADESELERADATTST